MSGDSAPSVELLDGSGGDVVSLVRTLDTIIARVVTPVALVGGLAVMARLGERHRVTVDVDTVYLETEHATPFKSVLVAEGGVVDGSTINLNGVAIDAIEVDGLVENDLPDDIETRSFVLAHRWALDTASPIRLVAKSSGGASASVLVPTATPAALIAMKLSCFATRRPRNRSHKQASDLHDLYRLLGVSDVPTLRAAYTQSPFDLAAVSARLARAMIEGGAADIIRALRLAGDVMQGVTLDAFAGVVETLLEATE